MDPTSSEADAKQLELARKQGETYREALDHMAENVAHDGGMQPADQCEYTLKVHIDPPTFHRHDEINGCRFTKPVDTEFTDVKVERGQD